jgi:hypothetical protein
MQSTICAELLKKEYLLATQELLGSETARQSFECSLTYELSRQQVVEFNRLLGMERKNRDRCQAAQHKYSQALGILRTNIILIETPVQGSGANRQ